MYACYSGAFHHVVDMGTFLDFSTQQIGEKANLKNDVLIQAIVKHYNLQVESLTCGEQSSR